MYSIKAISLMTGVKPETLRTWERRFDFVEPSRDENGRRVYSDHDARKLALVASLVDKGHPISRLAEMNTEALSALEADLARTSTRAHEKRFLDDLLEAVAQVAMDRFRLLVNRILVTQDPIRAIDDILTPAIREIGARWSTGELSVSDEHMLSNILKGELFGLIGILQIRAKGPKLVFATPSGEQHHLGMLLGAYVAASEGFRCVILGPDVPTDDLADAMNNMEADALVVSVIREQSFDLMAAHLRKVSSQLDPSTLMFVGAPAAFSTFLNDAPNIELFDRYEPFQKRLMTLM